MRTYTNFDLWKTYVHRLGLGKVEYRGKVVDLDEGAEILYLLIELHLAQIVSIYQGEDDDTNEHPWGLTYRLNGALAGMNVRRDGQVNDMQLGTVMLNLVEAGVLKRVSR